ncbi:MAG: phosphatase PAP2 family protein [Chloroflexi bacterium]|nr:phosphatase PAP2 family protein [Chloroflexota bacterium]
MTTRHFEKTKRLVRGMRTVVQQDWFGRDSWRFLLPAIVLTALQLLYFPLNMVADGNRSLSIAVIDDSIPRVSLFVVPYIVGIVYLSTANFFAAGLLARKHYQQHVFAFLTAMLIGFGFWYFFPAYIEKDAFDPAKNNPFDQLLYLLHGGDSAYGQHNSFPSSHVYYVTVGLVYLMKTYPQYRNFFIFSIVVNAASTLFTHQHYVIDVAAGFGLAAFAVWLSDTYLTPSYRRWEADANIMPPQTEST